MLASFSRTVSWIRHKDTHLLTAGRSVLIHRNDILFQTKISDSGIIDLKFFFQLHLTLFSWQNCNRIHSYWNVLKIMLPGTPTRQIWGSEPFTSICPRITFYRFCLSRYKLGLSLMFNLILFNAKCQQSLVIVYLSESQIMLLKVFYFVICSQSLDNFLNIVLNR